MSNTIQVKPWSDDQGDYVIIKEADFDPSFHELLNGESAKPAAPVDHGDVDKAIGQVIAMASDPAVQFLTFRSSAKKIIGDAIPSTKPEIVAALEALGKEPE